MINDSIIEILDTFNLTVNELIEVLGRNLEK